mmetsp:Transcript_11672/g.36404  ORF Transcript_11672/g.36404 Transcript_11672/m.36404 type:complete len:221 (-) Transcript_11672:302-964(-)
MASRRPPDGGWGQVGSRGCGGAGHAAAEGELRGHSLFAIQALPRDRGGGRQEARPAGDHRPGARRGPGPRHAAGASGAQVTPGAGGHGQESGHEAHEPNAAENRGRIQGGRQRRQGLRQVPEMARVVGGRQEQIHRPHRDVHPPVGRDPPEHDPRDARRRRGGRLGDVRARRRRHHEHGLLRARRRHAEHRPGGPRRAGARRLRRALGGGVQGRRCGDHE